MRKAEKSIQHSQRRIYRKVKGSLCIRKAKKIYSKKKHLKLTRQRIGLSKRVARCVIKSNDLVAYEDSRVANIVKTHCLAKLISDVSWYLFRQWLEYFAIKFGKVAIAVMPHYTSQKCSNCGVIVNIGKARVGQTQSNANGLATSTLLGENLVEQVTKVKLESQRLKTLRVSIITAEFAITIMFWMLPRISKMGDCPDAVKISVKLPSALPRVDGQLLVLPIYQLKRELPVYPVVPYSKLVAPAP